MKILYVSQYFPPEIGAPAARVSELSQEWQRDGEDVTVLTAFAHHPVGIKALGDRWRLTRRELARGVRLVRTYVWATPNAGVARRMISYASFMISAVVIGFWRVGRPDVVIATSPQLLCGCAGYILARAKRAPFVFEVRDLWPESILAVEAMRANPLIRVLRRVARFLYEHSDQIVTVGDGYRREIHNRYGVPLERIVSIPNGVDTEVFVPSASDNAVRREYGWDDRFVVMYVGTLGMAHGLSVALEAAARLRHDPRILFVFVGEGAEKKALQRQATQLKLDNVQFLEQQPKQRIPLFYAACDAGLVTLRDTPLFQSVLPSKIFEFLAMERPILLAVGGQAEELVVASGAGVSLPPGDPRALASAVIELKSREAADLEAMGRAGRRFVLARFHRKEQAKTYRQLLATVTQRYRKARNVDPMPAEGI